MEAISCSVRCSCGGTVDHLRDGVFYTITPSRTIIFRGVCNRCAADVKVEKVIQALEMLVPIDEKRVN